MYVDNREKVFTAQHSAADPLPDLHTRSEETPGSTGGCGEDTKRPISTTKQCLKQLSPTAAVPHGYSAGCEQRIITCRSRMI